MDNISGRTSEKSFESDGRPTHYIPKRYILTALSFFGIFNVSALRVNLSVAIVAMVNSTAVFSPNNTQLKEECPKFIYEDSTTETKTFTGEQYNWDAQQQGLILGAFFYGYIVTQIPGGFLAQKIGAKWLFGGGVIMTSILSLLTPVAAGWGIVPLFVLRVFEGLGEGVTYPAMNSMISRWSPKMERSRMSTIIYTGFIVGNVVSLPVSGLLCNSDALGRWPSVFYVFGAVGCVWFLFWAILVFETPSDHPKISKKELYYITLNNEETSQKKASLPWKAVLTSVPFWALLITHFGNSLGFLILFTELPTYLSKVLHFNIKENGLLSSLPYIFQSAVAWAGSYIADWLRKTNKMSITNIRKLCNSIAFFGPAICLLGVTISGCRPQLIVALFTLAMTLNGFGFSAFHVTHVDMSPTFAGTLYAITNTVANCGGIIGPAMVGAFTDEGSTMSNWSKIFYIASAVYVFTAIVFIAFGSAELQPWGRSEDPSKSSPVKEVTLANCQKNADKEYFLENR